MKWCSVLWALLLALAACSLPMADAEGDTLLAQLTGQVVSYEVGKSLWATVDSFRSRRGLMPFNFYSVPIPKPDEKRRKEERVPLNIGEILMGSREQPSNFEFVVGHNVSCKRLGVGKFMKRDIGRAAYLAKNKYYGTITLDGMPVLSETVSPQKRLGIRLGYRFGEGSTMNNFLYFTVMYVKVEDKLSITGFAVNPKSYALVDRCDDRVLEISSSNGVKLFDLMKQKDEADVEFYYSVRWVEDPSSSYASRMDIYERGEESKRRQKKGHWAAAMNSLLLAMLLGAGVAVVIARTVRRDLLKYADDDLADDLHEETGWKLVRGDVFRPPAWPVSFACLISAGCQLTLMFVSVFVASVVGVLHPTQRGNLLTGLIASFMISSIAAGYVGARMLKYFKQRSWANGFMTVALFPICLTTGYMTLNFIHWFKHSTSAIPFSALFVLLLSWLSLSLPLGLVGVTVGFRASAITVPARVSTIPRLIPAEAKQQLPYHLILGGLIPFCACFVELVYVLASFWQGERFYKLSFLAAVACIVAILCGEVAVVITYLALNHEDYRWWWRSFLSLASAGVYLYAYSLFYLFRYLELRLLSSMVLFCGYMAGVSVLFALVCGTVGFLSAAFFVRTIYSMAKSD